MYTITIESAVAGHNPGDVEYTVENTLPIKGRM
jgi:hypothetical protein